MKIIKYTLKPKFSYYNMSLDISKIVNVLKGYSSYALRKKYKTLAVCKSLWTNSYFCESIGHINQATIIKYIENQKST